MADKTIIAPGFKTNANGAYEEKKGGSPMVEKLEAISENFRLISLVYAGLVFCTIFVLK